MRVKNDSFIHSEIGCKDVDWFELAQNRALVNMVMNLWTS